jgi:MerR family mercuric resistance operon transcriptional regulator
MDFRIGELAEKSGVNKETIRYYERLGLIPEPPRTNAGYRIYSKDQLDRLFFIKRMKELGFLLKEIEKFLAVEDGNKAKCRDIETFTRNKIQEIQLKIRDLQRVEKMLHDLNNKCQCSCSSDTNFCDCPVIETVVSKELIN